MKRLQFIPHRQLIPAYDTTALEHVVWNVWKPSTKFSKKQPGTPHYKVLTTSAFTPLERAFSSIDTPLPKTSRHALCVVNGANAAFFTVFGVNRHL
jgi:hypothetical protein